jgi:hypothetical protein
MRANTVQSDVVFASKGLPGSPARHRSEFRSRAGGKRRRPAMADASLGPLIGTWVVEIGNFIAGSFCGQLLSNRGAEVIKIEHLRRSDSMRHWGAVRSEDQAVADPSTWRTRYLRDHRAVHCRFRVEEPSRLSRTRAAGGCGCSLPQLCLTWRCGAGCGPDQ